MHGIACKRSGDGDMHLDVWKPGDVVCRLDRTLRPARRVSFVALAGAGHCVLPALERVRAAIAAEVEREVGEFRRQREAEEARRLEEERLAEARRLEEERLAQAVAEAERLAAEAASKAEAERLAVEAKTVADAERLAAWAQTASPEAQRAVADRDARALVALLKECTDGSRQSMASGIAILADAPPDQLTDPMR